MAFSLIECLTPIDNDLLLNLSFLSVFAFYRAGYFPGLIFIVNDINYFTLK